MLIPEQVRWHLGHGISSSHGHPNWQPTRPPSRRVQEKYNLSKTASASFLLHYTAFNLLIEPATTGRVTGKLKITKAKAVQASTVALTSQPNLPRLKGLFAGRYLGPRRCHIRRAAGKEKEISSVSAAVPINTLKALANQVSSRPLLIRLRSFATNQQLTPERRTPGRTARNRWTVVPRLVHQVHRASS